MARVSTPGDERSVREFGRAYLAWFPRRRGGPAAGRLVVKSGGSTRFVRVVDIDWIEAAGVMRTAHRERNCCTGLR